jgi:hypothetical protein
MATPFYAFKPLTEFGFYSNVSFASDINPKRGVAALRAATHLFGFDLS